MNTAKEKGPRLQPRPLLGLTDEISLLHTGSESTPAAMQGQQEPPR